MAYQKIGIIGSTGKVGRVITRVLKDEGFVVIPYSRQNTTVAGLQTEQGHSFSGLDVLICALGHAGMQEQFNYIKQAKEAGVKRFVASEFGFGNTSPMRQLEFFKVKREIAEAVDKAGFPDGWTAIGTGFLDFCVPLFVPIDSEHGTITVIGSGRKEYPWTVTTDVGRTLAATFQNPAEYKNKWLTVINDWVTMSQVADIVREKSGKDWNIVTKEPTQATPVLQICEGSDLPLASREPESLPVTLSDFRDQIQI